MQKQLNLIGFASGIAGADIHCGQGPLVLKDSSLMQELKKSIDYQWQLMLCPSSTQLTQAQMVQELYLPLAEKVSTLVQQKKLLSVVGGDHSCAIGTWSGVASALKNEGDIGLIWVDAHMDSHTPETSESGRIHGMPLAVLLGHGYPELTHLLYPSAKLKPENIFIIGARSYEQGEAKFLQQKNVRVYFMPEVKQRGFEVILQEVVRELKSRTVAYGLSFDLDSVDPEEAPGVDVPEPDGLSAEEVLSALTAIKKDAHFVATEVVEFDPTRDKSKLTEKLMVNLLTVLTS